MGWYDEDEKGWWPDWATAPLMWIGSLLVAILPAAMTISLWNALGPDAPLAARLVAYGVSLGLTMAAIKPWTVR